MFQSYDPPLRDALLGLRELILKTAASTEGVGTLSETLKWGQPSYRPVKSGVGTTVRIDRDKSAPDTYAVYVHCQTGLVDTFRELYPNTFRFAGNRALVFRTSEEVPEVELSHCVALALTYHQRKRAG